MESVAEGLWSLADRFEKDGNIVNAIKCLEAICQSQVSFLPIVDVKTRLRIASLLLRHTSNVTHAKSHLERAQLLLKQLPTCFELKCRAYSMLSRCYHLLGTISSQKQTLRKGLELTASAGNGKPVLLWTCNFSLQLANALTTEGDYVSTIQVLESGLQSSERIYAPDLQLIFAISILHVYLMQWQDNDVVAQAISRCERIWNLLTGGTDQGELHATQAYKGLYVYKEMLQTLYHLRACDYKEATIHADRLDKVLGDETQLITEEQFQEDLLREKLKQLEKQLEQSCQKQVRAELCQQHQNVLQQLHELPQERQSWANDGAFTFRSSEAGKLSLGPALSSEEWLPRGAVVVLVDLLKAVCMRSKGSFKDCYSRIQKGLTRVQEELAQLGVTEKSSEVDLQHWSIWIVGVYLVLWFQLMENKVIVDLTQTELVRGQKALAQILDFFGRFPTMLQGCQSTIHMLLGQYAQSTGCYHEAAFHFLESSKLTDSKSMQAMSQVNAALSYICLEDYSQALDLIEPVYRNMDFYVGVREKTSVLFTSGVLQMKQGNLQEARSRLATGLTLTHKQLGNHQLLSQYLTALGSMATSINDTEQARDILKSAFTLAKVVRDLPTQVGVLSELTGLWRTLGESVKEVENSDYEARKSAELKDCIDAARASQHHLHLLQFTS